MFGRKRIKALEDRVSVLERIEKDRTTIESEILDSEVLRGFMKYGTKECEKCHGLFAEWVTGRAEIRKKKEWFGLCEHGFYVDKEYIHNPTYCKRCAPKKKKAKS